MSDIIHPGPGDHTGVAVNSPFLLVGKIESESILTDAAQLHLSAGQLTEGCATFIVQFGDTDYGREMADAVRSTITAMNQRWGLLDDWKPREYAFTGDALQPYKAKTVTANPT